jgi:hypothetical protein
MSRDGAQVLVPVNTTGDARAGAVRDACRAAVHLRAAAGWALLVTKLAW